jgi:MoaA/NifB/PqqE/SkfB family radical SAM enzyme
MTLKQWKAFIDEVAIFKPAILVSGVEPLFRSDIFEFLSYVCLEKGLRCEVNTNGYLLPEKAEGLVNSGIEKLYVSLDGPQKVHDCIRGVDGCHERVIEGLKRVIALTEKRHKPGLSVFYTISDYNFQYLAPTLSILEGLGVKDMLFTHLLFINEQMSTVSNKLHPEFPTTPVNISDVHPGKIDIDVLASQIKEVKRNKKIKANFFPELPVSKLAAYYREPLKLISNNRCIFAWNLASIRADGELMVIPRCSVNNLGNVNKTPFKQLWNSKSLRDFRIALKDIGSYPSCSRCCALFR